MKIVAGDKKSENLGDLGEGGPTEGGRKKEKKEKKKKKKKKKYGSSRVWSSNKYWSKSQKNLAQLTIGLRSIGASSMWPK